MEFMHMVNEKIVRRNEGYYGEKYDGGQSS